MNKNILDIANKAGVGGLKHIGNGEWEIQLSPAEQKFAELIIKECGVVAARAINNDNELRHITDVLNEYFDI